MKLGKFLVVLACGLMSVFAEAAEAFAIPRAEFAKYYTQITGKAPAADLASFAVDATISKSGRDAYTIVSTGSGVKITGSNARSVLYGVYDLLERRGGCHWFWDGDVVPKKATVDLSGLDVREEARFEYRGLRYFAHRGLTRFQAEHWGLEDWKKEIDWMLKRRLNVFMLRIGQDDLFQRTFPETCAYPDPAKPMPGTGKGYDNRSLFWSLEYRGKLRHDLQQYAFARGLMVPEDFGTMTHWYSRTPEDFLAKKDPPFLPQSTRGYSEKNGLVWDIRDEKWADEYWKLTTTAVDAYGQGAPERLLHTIGLGERKCYTNRQDNFKLKLEALDKFMTRAKRDYPDSKVLLAGWDFYFTWEPEEVQALVKKLDPKHAIIWDYEGDVTHYRPGYSKPNDFTQWGLVGKFPYTYSIFLAYESALDTRANYPVIEARQKIVQNDPACAGYILWPESSHTDTLCLRYFTANAWSSTAVPHQEVLDEFCASRYGAQAAAMKPLWAKALPLSWMLRWRGGCNYVFTTGKSYPAENAEEIERLANWKGFEAAPAIFAGLAQMPWTDDFLHRDTVDLARMVLDRVIVYRATLLKRDYLAWQKGMRDGADLPARAANLAALMAQMADLLALHTDYSLWDSYVRLDAIEKVRNPDFPQVLFDNAANHYCRSHQYELARYFYLPCAQKMAANVAASVSAGNRKAPLSPGKAEAIRLALMEKPLESLKPTLPRTVENFHVTMQLVEALLK